MSACAEIWKPKKSTYLSTENLFKVPKDSVCSKTLADLCLELGFKLKNSVNVSSRVCKACGRNLRSTNKFYKLIETAIGKEIPDVQVVDTKIETDDENVAEEARVKRQLPTTISPERNRSKTVKIQCTTTRRSLNFKKPEQPELNENQDNVKDNDNVLSALNIEDLIEKKTSQVKIVIVNPSGKIETWHNFDEDRKSLLLNIARNKWTIVANLMFKHPKLEKELDKPLEKAISNEFKELCSDSSKSVLSKKSPEDVAKFKSKAVFDEISAKCPLWTAAIKGASGVRNISSASKKKINAIALSSAIAARTRNHKMSAMAYRISTILFHSGVKSEDVTRLSRLGVCMSPDQVVDFQKKMGKTCCAKLEVWKKEIEKVKKAELLLNEVLDSNDEKSFDLSDTSCSHLKYYSKEIAEHCRSVLKSVAQQGVFTREVLITAVAKLTSCILPTYK